MLPAFVYFLKCFSKYSFTLAVGKTTGIENLILLMLSFCCAFSDEIPALIILAIPIPDLLPSFSVTEMAISISIF